MFDALPPGFADLPPGPELAGALATIVVDRLTGYDRVVALQAEARMEAHYAARKTRAMVAVRDALAAEFAADPVPGDDADEAALAEIQAALCLTGAAAASWYADALALRNRVPAVWEALAAGRIDAVRARVLVDETAHLEPDAGREVVDAVLGWAADRTTTQIKRRVRRLALALAPAAAAERFETALEERRVEAYPNPDGTTNLVGVNLPAHRVAAISAYLTRLARRLRRNGDPRTMDQLRADLLVELLSGRRADGPGEATGFVELRVDIATLVGLDELPGDLGGYGPVVADLARQLALASPHLEWRYVIADPDTGRIRQVGTTRRRPSARMRRFVTARDPTCPYPGCVASTGDAEIDHIRPWSEGGLTTPDNLAPPCPKHHQLRHRNGWTYTAFGDADYLWTSRLGHQYVASGQPP